MGENETTKIWQELKMLNTNITTLITKTDINCPEQRRKIRRLEFGFMILMVILVVFLAVEAKIAWGMLKVVVPFLVKIKTGGLL